MMRRPWRAGPPVGRDDAPTQPTGMKALLRALRSAMQAGSKPRATYPEHSGDTAEGCRGRAAADFHGASNTSDLYERRRLIKGAKSWSLRADMFDRIGKSFRKRAALDEASRRYRRDKD